MVGRYDVIIRARHIQLNVVIPEKYAWEFMEKFGETFATKNFDWGGKDFKAVDGYYKHPRGWHIQVSVWEKDEKRFYDFLRDFCSIRNISFREPEAHPRH